MDYGKLTAEQVRTIASRIADEIIAESTGYCARCGEHHMRDEMVFIEGKLTCGGCLEGLMDKL